MASDFSSVIITPTSPTLTIQVGEQQFVRIRNFTQEGGTQRGTVSVTANGATKNVLTAAMIDKGASSNPTESVESVVIAGPAQITIAPVTGATLFVTYRRQTEPAPPTPTATPTVTPIFTVTPTPTATP